MPTSATAQLQRLQTILASLQRDYDTLCYVFLEDVVEVTVHSRNHSVTLPLLGDSIGNINMELSQALYQRIQSVEAEILIWHRAVIVEQQELSPTRKIPATESDTDLPQVA